MKPTLETLLQAKAELARRAQQPLIPFRAHSLIGVATELRNAHDYINGYEPDGSGAWLMNDAICAQYGLLCLHAWNITNPEVPLPDLSQITIAQLCDWIENWEKRLSNWSTAESHLFETSVSWAIVNKFLDVWYANQVRTSLPHGRGCAQWLKDSGVIHREATTTFDREFNRTVVS